MALEIFKLVGSIFVDNTEADKNIQKTDEKAEGLGKTLLNGVETAAKWSAALVGAATATAGAMYAVATKTAANAEEIDKMSQKLGLSREAYQEWDYILSQSGMDINSMQAGIKTLTNSIDDAVNGSDKATERFKQLGITEEELATLSREEIFAKAIKGLQGMEDNAQRAALANDLFGKSGQNLAPLLNSTAESTENLKNQAHELGMIMSDEAIDSGVELTDTIDTVKRMFEGLGNDLGSEFMPIVQEVLQYLIDGLPQIKAIFDQLTPILTSAFATLMPALTDLAKTIIPIILDLITQLMPVFAQIVQTILPVLVQILNTLLPPFMQLVQSLLPVVVTTLDVLLPLLEPIAGLLVPIVELLNLFLEPLVKLLNELLPPIIELIGAFVAVLTEDLGICLEAVTIFAEDTFGQLEDLGEDVKNIFSFIPEFFGKLFSNAWENIKNVFKPWAEFFGGLWDTITEIFHKVGTAISDAISGSVKSAVNTVLDGAIGIINGFISAINKAISIINKIPKVHISKIDKIEVPQLATGGEINGQGSAIVGEAGAELIDLPQGAKVTPLSRSNGQGGTVEQKIDQMVMLLQELVVAMPDAVAEGVQTLQWQWNDRELGRMVKAYE